MRHGYNRSAGEVIVSVGRPTVRSFCYHYEIGFGKRHASRDFTVAVARIDAQLPGVLIGRGMTLEAVTAFERFLPTEVDWLEPSDTDAGRDLKKQP